MELLRSRRLYREWVAFGNREPGARPMLTIELGTFQGEMLDPLMQCEGEEARRIEVRLREKMFNFQLFSCKFSSVPGYDLIYPFRSWPDNQWIQYSMVSMLSW